MSKSDLTTDERMFKKTEHVVGRPTTTDHNINEKYIRNPPDNLASTVAVPATDRRSWGLKEGARVSQDVDKDSDVGRPKKAEVESSIVQENSIHPNT